jgi:uncharacterized protein (DUF302 family)
MTSNRIALERFSIVSSKPFNDVVAALEASIGHPDMKAFMREMASAPTFAALEAIVGKAAGPAGFLEMARFDLGMVQRKAHGESAPRILRLLIGNPVVMKRMVEHVPDAGSYAPVTILVDERRDGVHLSYDLMASLLASYANPEALKVAEELDAKIRALLTSASI